MLNTRSLEALKVYFNLEKALGPSREIMEYPYKGKVVVHIWGNLRKLHGHIISCYHLTYRASYMYCNLQSQ
jgi:hypothetical protein